MAIPHLTLKDGRKITVFGDHDANTLQQMSQVASHEKAIASAIMADGHLGYGMPIGGVVGYDNAVSPEGVGFDIACGNKAVQTFLVEDDIRKDLDGIMDAIFSEVAFGVGQASGKFKDYEVFDRDEWDIPIAAKLKQKAREQLGSVGSGNHYVDLMIDEDGFVWIGVHFGSRGLGHGIAKNFMTDGDMMKEVSVIDLDTDQGTDYWFLMELAGAYAYAGRDCAVSQVMGILGTKDTQFEVHNHHNFAWKEYHDYEGDSVELVVVRKGATPAFPGQEGFVGGSMGDDAVILQGYEHDGDLPLGGTSHQRQALFSTVHGAGRVMSRTEAKGKVHRKTGRRITEPAIDRAEVDEWLKRRGVVLRGADLDEAPQAYRRLDKVLIAQGATIEVNHTLTPIGVAMAGPKDWDPYKD